METRGGLCANKSRAFHSFVKTNSQELPIYRYRMFMAQGRRRQDREEDCDQPSGAWAVYTALDSGAGVLELWLEYGVGEDDSSSSSRGSA